MRWVLSLSQFNRGEDKLSHFSKFGQLVSSHSEFEAHMTVTQRGKVPAVDLTMAPKIACPNLQNLYMLVHMTRGTLQV